MKRQKRQNRPTEGSLNEKKAPNDKMDPMSASKTVTLAQSTTENDKIDSMRPKKRQNRPTKGLRNDKIRPVKAPEKTK